LSPQCNVERVTNSLPQTGVTRSVAGRKLMMTKGIGNYNSHESTKNTLEINVNTTTLNTGDT